MIGCQRKRPRSNYQLGVDVSNPGHAPSLSVLSQTAQKENIGRISLRGITHISSESGDDEEDEVSALEQKLDKAEDSAHMLKEKLGKADFRIKTVVEYAEHQRRIKHSGAILKWVPSEERHL